MTKFFWGGRDGLQWEWEGGFGAIRGDVVALCCLCGRNTQTLTNISNVWAKSKCKIAVKNHQNDNMENLKCTTNLIFVINQQCQMSTISNVNKIKCQQFQMSTMSNLPRSVEICPDLLRYPQICWDPSRSVEIRPDQSRSYEICLIMSKCQSNCQIIGTSNFMYYQSV